MTFSDGRFEQVIKEAVRSVAADERAEALFLLATARASLDRMPGDLRSVRSFLEGHLLPVVADQLGQEMAEVVRRDLDPVLQLAQAHDDATLRSRSVSGASPKATDPQAVTWPAPARIPSMVVVTADEAAVQNIHRALTRWLTVQHASFLAEIEALLTGPVDLIVLDCRDEQRTTVPPRSLARLALGRRQVLIWGVEDASALSDVPEDDVHWHGCAAQATSEEVAYMCLMLLENGNQESDELGFREAF